VLACKIIYTCIYMSVYAINYWKHDGDVSAENRTVQKYDDVVGSSFSNISLSRMISSFYAV
jgi:hypothetical protein